MPVDVAGAGVGLAPEVFRLAIEASPGGMVFIDGGGAIVLINREIERLFGYSQQELLGRPVEILLPSDLRGKHARQRNGFLKHPGARHLGTGRDFLARRKDGSVFPIEVGLNPIRIGGEVMVLCAVVDLSERKRIERLRDEFITTVSHELRTPMTSIAGSLGLMIGGAAGSLPRSAAHLIEIAHTNCQRLVRLVNDILDIKKLESGQMDFHIQRYSARALVEQAIDANRGFADGYSVRIRLNAPAEAFDLLADADRFLQVITNLLSNALKFSPAGGEVVVSIERCGNNVRIKVRDYGPGIPASFKPRVFEKFAQANFVGGRQKTGTGLGLSIVKQIVTHMHGQVGFDDAPGGGTIFCVDLPAADQLARRKGKLAGGAEPPPSGEELPVAAHESASAAGS